jgi:hypothetical protein
MDTRERVLQERAYEIRERAYQIWEREGRPTGRDREHWLQAERELAREQGRAEPQEPEDIEAAREYERELKNFARQRRVESAAGEARRALGGAEAESLKQAERDGKRRAKSKDR